VVIEGTSDESASSPAEY